MDITAFNNWVVTWSPLLIAGAVVTAIGIYAVSNRNRIFGGNRAPSNSRRNRY